MKHIAVIFLLAPILAFPSATLADIAPPMNPPNSNLTCRADHPALRCKAQDVPWAEFDVTFPASQDVGIEAACTLAGVGDAPCAATFYYILETDAGWKETIGSANVILRRLSVTLLL